MIENILPIIAGVLSIGLGAVVLFNETTRRSIRLSFAIFSGGVGVWAIFISLFRVSTDQQWAHSFVLTYYIAALLIAYGFMTFGFAYSSVRISRPFVVLSGLSFLLLSL